MKNNNISLEELKIKYAYFLSLKSQDYFDKTDDALVSFSYNGVCIHNPFIDESGRFEVNPIKYYGVSFIKSIFYNVLKVNEDVNVVNMSNEALIEAYHLLKTNENLKAHEIVGDIESKIVGRGSLYEINHLLDLVDDGYEWIHLDTSEKVAVIAQNIKKYIIN